MVTTDLYQIVVCDAGPLIHLDELGCLELLNDFAEVIVPDAVWQEVEQHRPSALHQAELTLHRRTCALPNAEIDALAALFTLHRGEKEALRLACEIGSTLLLTRLLNLSETVPAPAAAHFARRVPAAKGLCRSTCRGRIWLTTACSGRRCAPPLMLDVRAGGFFSLSRPAV